MIVIVAILIGAYIGDAKARRIGGNRKDRLQYAAAHGIAFAILGLLATVFLDRTLRG